MFLEAIDIYGLPYNFTIFKNEVFKTKIGGFFSILTFICFAMSFIFFGEDFYNRQNPKFINEKLSSENYTLYNLSNHNFAAAVRVEDDDGNYVDVKRYLNLTVDYVIEIRDNITGRFSPTYFPKNLINCTNSNVPYYKNTYDNNTMLCVDFDGVQLGGYWDSNFVNFMLINVQPCINNTDQGIDYCYNYNDVKSYTLEKSLTLNIASMYYFTNLNDKSSPLQIRTVNTFIYIDLEKSKTASIFYKTAEITSDMGIIAKNYQTYSVLGIDNIINDIADIASIISPSTSVYSSQCYVQIIMYVSLNTETFFGD